jgi:hypothetical protein
MPKRRNRKNLKPHFIADTRTLSYGGLIVKKFRVPAGNQMLILQVFEELRWCKWIDDPLPPHFDVDPKRRLHDAINRLNRHQQNGLLKFHGDGTGTRIGWSVRAI